MMTAVTYLASLAMVVSAQSTELKPCGAAGDFDAGKVECAIVNGSDAEANGWHLVKRTEGKNWWQDSETETVWGPTHAFFLNGNPENGVVAFSYKDAEEACVSEGASLPTLEEYYYAFAWRYGLVVMDNSVESVLGQKPVFWASSATYKENAWWVLFDDDGSLADMPFVPLSKQRFPGDFRCVWRK